MSTASRQPLVVATLVIAALGSAAAQTQPLSKADQERARIELERKRLFDPANPATRAAPGPLPSGSALEREIQRVERERKDLFDPENPATRNAPNTFPDVPTPQRSEVDIEAIARQYEHKAKARKADGLMVFASFTMPTASLKRLIADTARVGGAVLFRGFKDGSIKATSLAITSLGAVAGGVQVNPDAFTKYRITAVPAVVLVKPEASDQVDGEGCALPDDYVMVAGDVGVGYALDEIARRSPGFREVAVRYGRPLQGTSQ
jgi:conjugal transfer pilus assembly protein TrbC